MAVTRDGFTSNAYKSGRKWTHLSLTGLNAKPLRVSNNFQKIIKFLLGGYGFDT
jgi:hypothetical protein